MRNLIPVLMLVMSLPAMAFVPVNNGCDDGCLSYKDSIRVSEKYRVHFMKALESVFGPNAVNFSYTTTGALIYNGDTASFPAEEREIFRKFRRIMATDTITNIIYGKYFEVTSKTGHVKRIDVSQHGGEATLLIKTNPDFSENYIGIDLSYKSRITVEEVTPAYYVFRMTRTLSGNMFDQNRKIKINPMEGTWHGLGHAIYAGHPLDNVIDFDNLARNAYKVKNQDGTFKSAPMSLREYDWQHNKTKIVHDSTDKDMGINNSIYRRKLSLTTPPLPL